MINRNLRGARLGVGAVACLALAAVSTGCNRGGSNAGSAGEPTATPLSNSAKPTGGNAKPTMAKGAPEASATPATLKTTTSAYAATPGQLAPLPAGGVKGIYLTGWSAGLKKKLNKLVGLADRTEINAFVIDVKDDGEVSYDCNVPLVKEIGAGRKMFKIDKLMPVLYAHNIYPIARIACMRDSILPKKHPEMAVHSPSGGVWKDRSGHTWLNPYHKAVWDYNVDVALDALKHGFKEVQFDYVRFPSEGKVSTLVYPGKPKGALREDQIAAFMKYAHDKIHAAGGWFSADVFGLTSLVKNDEGIGQKFNKVIQNVDYLCPMVYPSHYAYGEYGFKDPNKEPYKLITKSVGDAQKRMKDTPTCKLRPWIQDFSLRGVHYGPAEVRAQIKALHDLKIEEYLMWNAGNNFTEAALRKDTPPKTAAAPASPAKTGSAAPVSTAQPVAAATPKP